MTDIAIRAEGVSKKFRIGSPQARYRTVRETIVESAAAPFRRARSLLHGEAPGVNGRNEVWALKDVSFEVKRGEVVGIIGPNGAGKSTLLKILSRITKPTKGYVDLYGRVGSLLEVGTGFHPELTGRENIYLSGAILGMKRAEIDNRFDEIVDFSGVEKFVDTPVKHFSSGMYLRLAFAVAAHLEPEILLVDEVLAVGDAEFQKKCLGKMGDVAQEGRTVLFVSHNLTAVSNLCQRALVLNSGGLYCDGNAQTAIQAYLGLVGDNSEVPLVQQINRLSCDPVFRLLGVYVGQEGNPQEELVTSRPISVAITYEVKQSVRDLRIGFDLHKRDTGAIVFRTFQDDLSLQRKEISAGRYVSSASIPADLLGPWLYQLSISVGIHGIRWIIVDQVHVSFNITNVGRINVAYADARPGSIMPAIAWSTCLIE